MYVPPQRVWFLRRFGLKKGIDFVHFGLESNMGVYERIRRFNSKWISKGRVLCKFESVFKKLFCWRSNLSNDDIIS